MHIDLTVPDWVHAYVRLWKDRLALNDWEIKIELDYIVGNEPDVMGMCSQYPDLNLIRITLRADIEENRKWKEYILHELIHGLHARVDHFIDQAVLPRFEGHAFAIATTAWRQVIESFVDQLSHSLYKLGEQIDGPPSE